MIGGENMVNIVCDSCSCTSCQKEHSLTLEEKIVGTIIGLIFFSHLLALRQLAYLKMRKEYIKMMNDPMKQKELIRMIVKQAFQGENNE
jgi:hypothetical protein